MFLPAVLTATLIFGMLSLLLYLEGPTHERRAECARIWAESKQRQRERLAASRQRSRNIKAGWRA